MGCYLAMLLWMQLVKMSSYWSETGQCTVTGVLFSIVSCEEMETSEEKVACKERVECDVIPSPARKHQGPPELKARRSHLGRLRKRDPAST